MPMTLTNLKHAFRKNVVLLLTTIGLFLAISLVIYYSEQQFYYDKWNYIVQHESDFFSTLTVFRDDLETSEQLYQLTLGNNVDLNAALLQRKAQEIVNDPDNIIYYLELSIRPTGTLIVSQNNSKLKSMNDYRNSLFNKYFSKEGLRGIEFDNERRVLIKSKYTSPVGDSNLERIVFNYRMTIFPILIILIGLYAAGLHMFIIPEWKVIDKLESIREKFGSKIQNPRSLIETAYNRMAINTQILNINLQMIDLVAKEPMLSVDQVLIRFLKLVHEIFPDAYLLRKMESNGNIAFYKIGENGNDTKGIQINLSQNSNLNMGTDTNIYQGNDSGKPIIAVQIDKIGNETWFLTRPDTGLSSESSEFVKQNLSTLAQQMKLAIQSKELQRRFVEQEKSQVSIHLARNLGHDVTNIVASVRWDLNTLETILREQISKSDSVTLEENRKIVSESLDGLTHGTRLLQEIVDVYRSFMFLEKPVFESVDIQPILTQLVELFRRATTYRIELKISFEENLPKFYLEPRLFKLAIFNLLTNSLDAIKRSAQDKQISGLIELEVHKNKDSNELIVSVKDNGPGLRQPDGSLIPDNEMNRLFQYGYSTKEKTPGGLGLAWVYTIICDIHKGQISAKNRPEGGAEFTVTLPNSSKST